MGDFDEKLKLSMGSASKFIVWQMEKSLSREANFPSKLPSPVRNLHCAVARRDPDSQDSRGLGSFCPAGMRRSSRRKTEGRQKRKQKYGEEEKVEGNWNGLAMGQRKGSKEWTKRERRNLYSIVSYNKTQKMEEGGERGNRERGAECVWSLRMCRRAKRERLWQ